ncbi:hypothetical protein ACP70R_015303 [Stipagrostis hirtigluma subsp. patula]
MSAPAGRPRCAACRKLCARCPPHCVFAPHFPADSWGSARFAIVREVFPGGPSKLANFIRGRTAYGRRSPGEQREAVNELVYDGALSLGTRVELARPAGTAGPLPGNRGIRLAVARHLAGYAERDAGEPDAVAAAAAAQAAAGGSSSSAVQAALAPPQPTRRMPKCAACQKLGRPCTPRCVFAPHFPAGNRGALRFVAARDACGGAGKLALLIGGYRAAGLSLDQQREAIDKLVYGELATGIPGGGIEQEPVDAAPPLIQQPPPSEQQAAAAAAAGVPEAADQGGDPSQAVGIATEAEDTSQNTTGSGKAQEESLASKPPNLKRKREETGSDTEEQGPSNTAGSEYAQEESSAPAPTDLKRKKEE